MACGATQTIRDHFAELNDDILKASMFGICDRCTTGLLWYDKETGIWYEDGYGNVPVGEQRLSDETYETLFRSYEDSYGVWKPGSDPVVIKAIIEKINASIAAAQATAA